MILNGLEGLFRSAGLCCMLDEKNYGSIENVFSLLSAFIDRGTDYKR